MRGNRINSKRLRLLVSIFIFTLIVIVYLIANPPSGSFDFVLTTSNLLSVAVALITAIGAAQPVANIVTALFDFFAKQNDEEIPTDLRDKILANQHRLWIAGILRRSIYNDPLIVPYNEIENIALISNRKVKKIQFKDDIAFKEKIQARIDATDREKYSTHKKTATSKITKKTILDAYSASSGQLVILGEGGSGKTIALLQLLEHLHHEAQKDVKKYIPVVFNLGSWEEKQLSLIDWLASELLDSFSGEAQDGLLKALAYQIKRQKMIFLFDGLDEISKSSRCLFYTELTDFSNKMRGQSLQYVICSRPEEFAETEIDVLNKLKISSNEEKLKGILNNKWRLNYKTIILRSIDDSAILQYLEGNDYDYIRKKIFGMDNKAIEKFLRTRNTEKIKKDIADKNKLYEPAHHPFILNALAEGYKNPPEFDIENLEISLTEKTDLLVGEGLQPIPKIILDRYVSQRFDTAKAEDYELFNQEITNEHLSWIAYKQNSTFENDIKGEDKAAQTEISVESLQPTWLDNNYWRLAYFIVSRMISTVAITIGVGFILASPLDYLVAGMLAGIVIGVLEYVTNSFTRVKKLSIRIGAGWFRVIRFIISLLTCWLILSIFLGLVTPAPSADKIFFGKIAISGITLAWFLSIFISVIYITREIRLKLGDVEPAEILKFEFGAMGRYALIGGVSIGAFVAIFAQVLLSKPDSSTAIWLAGVIEAIGIGLLGAGLVGFLAGAFFGGIFAGVFGLLSVSSIEEYERTRPNQGIRKSLINALSVALSLTIVFSAIFFTLLWLAYHDSDVAIRAIRNGLTVGILGGLWSGGISTIHQITLRFFLFISGRMPWNISRFLHYCSQINIMREIGGSYKFGHEYVRLYYSTYNDKNEIKKTTPQWLYIVSTLILFVSFFGLGYIRQALNTRLYSFDVPNQYRVGYPTILGQHVSFDIFVKENQKVTIISRGVVRTGDYVGYVTPEGTNLGIFGIGQGGSFNLVKDFPNNALICKLDTESEWRICAYAPRTDGSDIFFSLPWQIREACFIAPKDGQLEFDTNDNEPEKRKGAFFVVVTVSDNSTCQQ